MTKRKKRFYRTLRFYNQDIFGRLVSKDPKSFRTLSKGFKNAKINNFLYEKKEESVERLTRFQKGFGLEKFAYRIDVVKLKRRRRRLSLFAKRLKTRFIIRKFASEMTVRQFRSYIKRSLKSSFFFFRFLSLLEKRIDFFVFRMNLFQNSGEARQRINHGFILLNGRICYFPSTQVKFFDVVSISDKEFFFNKLLSCFKNNVIFKGLPSYLEVNYRIMSGIFIGKPSPSSIRYPVRVNPTLLASLGKRF